MPIGVVCVDDWYQIVDGRRVHRRRGDSVDISEEDFGWAVRCGIAKPVAEESQKEPQEEPQKEEPVDDEPEEGEVENPKAPEEGDTSGEESKPDKPNRPPHAANRKAWDAYAKSVGVDPERFKSKEELIAALP